jgi:hypothetical protein
MDEFKIQVDEFTVTDPSHGIGPDAQYFDTPEKSIAYYGKYHEEQIRKWYAKYFKVSFKCDINQAVDDAVEYVCHKYGFDKPEGLLYDDAVDELASGLSEAYTAADTSPDHELTDYCDEQCADMEWSDICDEVKKQFGLSLADVIAIKIDDYIKYGVIDSTEYLIITADKFNKTLEDILSARDNKNGCQLYTNHFRITGGACFDSKTDKQVGFRITKVYFRKIAW